jgi:penicillin-binding protein 1A
MRVVALLGLGFVVLLALAAAVGAWFFKPVFADLPDVASLQNYHPPLVTTVWSRDGGLMAELAEERRKVIDVSDLPERVIHAFLASEDSQFFEHEGLDWKGIARAAWANLRERRVAQGGSTITQQVAKSLLLSPVRSFRRKAREAVLAIRIEKNLSKREILYLYLNQIYLGHGAYGVESASEIYFGISSRKLSLAQASLLAGLPQAPSRYDPFQHPERSLERRRYVLEQMADKGWVSREEALQAATEPLELHSRRNPYSTFSPFFSEHVRRLLEERYGRETLLREGFYVVTTMDSRLQSTARKALRTGLEAVDRRQGYRGPLDQIDPESPNALAEGVPPEPGQRVRAMVRAVDDGGAVVLVAGVQVPLPRDGLAWALSSRQQPADVFHVGDVVLCDLESSPDGSLTARLVQEPQVEGALVCLDPRTGEVLACGGGYGFDRSQFNRAVQAQRQPGSAIKPLIYSAALEKGYTPATLVYDSPIVYDSPDLEEKWKPKNYSKRFYGATPLREALVRSRNVVTIKVLRDIGVPHAVEHLQRLGIASPISPDLSLALGASAVNLLELATVYGAIPVGGVRRDPVFILRIEDREGRVIEAFTPSEGEKTIQSDAAYVLTHMMQAVIQEGTGRRARGLGRPAAGKTGTTNDNRDAWFLGFTPDLVAGVWVGFDDGHSLGKRETGGKAAAPIWLDFMREATKGRRESDFSVSEGVEFARIDKETGMLAGPMSKKTFTAAFSKGTVPEAARSRDSAPTSAAPLDPKDPGALNALR